MLERRTQLHHLQPSMATEATCSMGRHRWGSSMGEAKLQEALKGGPRAAKPVSVVAPALLLALVLLWCSFGALDIGPTRSASGWQMVAPGQVPQGAGVGGGVQLGRQAMYPMSPLAPSRVLYYASQVSPELAESDSAVVAEFEAAPWLLPPRTPALPYTGVHGFDELLGLRAQPVGSHGKGIVLMLFSRDWAVMVQNSVYSLVKHAGARNYVMLTWNADDLAACADLNLPCADVSHMLVEPIFTTTRLLQHDFLVMMHLKPACVLAALRQGYVVMSSDSDVSYTVKPLWDSYLAFIAQSDADGAWQSESPLNSGHFVVLPTRAGLAFATDWQALSKDLIKEKLSEQKGLERLQNQSFVACRLPCRCWRDKYELLAKGTRDKVAVFAAYLPGHMPYTASSCTVGSKEWMPPVDPCDWQTLYIHPICSLGGAVKEGVLRAINFWWMDQCKPKPGSASQVRACRPLFWREPQAEARHYSCQAYSPGLVHGEPPPAIKALQAGVSAEEARQLLLKSQDKECSGRHAEPLEF